MSDNLTADFDDEHRSNGQGTNSSIDWDQAQEGVQLLLDAIGEDTSEETLSETWRRRVPATFETLTEGTRQSEKPRMETFEEATEGFIVKTGIPVYSLCKHHLLPYHGTAHIGYRPDGAVIGLSKLARYVRWQSRRLTVQEGLTREVAEGLADEIGASAVIVEIRATHLCEAMRGIETATETVTRAAIGEIADKEAGQFNRSIGSD